MQMTKTMSDKQEGGHPKNRRVLWVTNEGNGYGRRFSDLPSAQKTHVRRPFDL
jgi:hypothetical protein